MKYVYIVQSELDSERYYTGITDNIKGRLNKHNAGEVKHTSKYRSWRIKTYVAFTDEKRACEFEQYLKTGSGQLLLRSAYNSLNSRWFDSLHLRTC